LERDTEIFASNLRKLTHTQEETVADPDTLSYYLKKLDINFLSSLPIKMMQTLIRNKVLDQYRLLGHFLIAIDASGEHSFSERHCEHCLTKTKNGVTTYYHQVLSGKLVTENGMALEVGTIFIENPEEFKLKDKQDCELKAFYRLAPILKERFPRTPFCILLDGLYEAKQVFNICEKNGWKYMINFKEGSMPALYEEAKTLLELSFSNRLQTSINRTTDSKNAVKQSFGWIDELPYEGHNLKAIFFKETVANKITSFEYITNFKVERNNVEQLVNKGGRKRWNIENQGFKSQKQEGFALEHVYSMDLNTSKNFYFLLQIAHIIFQLMVKGSLFDNFYKQMGSLKNFTKRLAENLRRVLIPDILLEHNFQIRFNSS
jgi:hypothetical protein